MSEAFGYSFEDYLMFGGYPGAAILKSDANRWREYMRDSIVESTISRDVLQMEDVRKPALMRALLSWVRSIRRRRYRIENCWGSLTIRETLIPCAIILICCPRRA